MIAIPKQHDWNWEHFVCSQICMVSSIPLECTKVPVKSFKYHRSLAHLARLRNTHKNFSIGSQVISTGSWLCGNGKTYFFRLNFDVAAGVGVFRVPVSKNPSTMKMLKRRLYFGKVSFFLIIFHIEKRPWHISSKAASLPVCHATNYFAQFFGMCILPDDRWRKTFLFKSSGY